MRVQLALNVPDIEAAKTYYSKLFNTEPHKIRDGYANFAVNDPPLKLVLFENPRSEAHLHHIGVEVLEEAGVETAQKRLEEAGLVDDVLHDTQCCHAKQKKIWSKAHNGLRWEWYWVEDENTTPQEDALYKTCCVEDRD
ncbi:MAG: ArsI/CadI family heavy metal resistance metalloenzyme [Methyloligellaceae bacterium]